MLKSLSKLIDGSGDMSCVAALGHLRNVVSELSKVSPDIVLMDIGLPDISGIEGVRTVKTNFESVQILMFTVFDNDEKIFEAIRAGACGYLLKKTEPDEILAAIRQLNEGGAPMSPGIARKMVQAFQLPPQAAVNESDLTVREKEILYALADGLSYKKIADKYYVSISTVRSHICHIYEKLHVHSRAQAVARLLRNKQA